MVQIEMSGLHGHDVHQLYNRLLPDAGSPDSQSLHLVDHEIDPTDDPMGGYMVVCLYLDAFLRHHLLVLDDPRGVRFTRCRGYVPGALLFSMLLCRMFCSFNAGRHLHAGVRIDEDMARARQ